jgi:ADP-heptose:LPS heptosyltransferase
MLGLLEAEGIEPVRDMRLHAGELDRRWAERWLAEQRIEPGRYLVLAPTAQWLSKRWPAARFGQIAQRLADHRPAGADFGAAVVVGSPGEHEQARPLLQRHWSMPLHDLVGRTTVGQLMALIEQCGLALCNDSAALHLAVGFGRRCLGVFGPTEPRWVGPYRYELGVARADGGESVHYRAARLDQDLIASLDVEVVWEQVQRVLNAPPPPTVFDHEK